MSTSRLSTLDAALQAAGLDAIALNPGPSLTYLTGLIFHLMERPIVIVEEANRAGCAIAGPGVACARVDEATREVIENAGYGEYFTHRNIS